MAQDHVPWCQSATQWWGEVRFFFEASLSSLPSVATSPDQTVLVFWTTNDLAGRKRMPAQLQNRVSVFAQSLKPYRRCMVILGGPHDLWGEWPEYDANVAILRDLFNGQGIVTYLGHELYHGLRAFKADRYHFLNKGIVRTTLVSFILAAQQLLQSIVPPMEFCQGQQGEWFPLDLALLRKALDLPRMTLLEDGNWELTEAGGGRPSSRHCAATRPANSRSCRRGLRCRLFVGSRIGSSGNATRYAHAQKTSGRVRKGLSVPLPL